MEHCLNIIEFCEGKKIQSTAEWGHVIV